MKQTQKNKIEWKNLKISEVCLVDSGQGAPQGEKYFQGTEIFVRAGDLNKLTQNIFVGDFCKKITSEAINKHKLKKFKKNSIVFPKSGMSIKTNNIALLKYDSYVVNHLAILECEKINPKFLFYLLKKNKISNLCNNTSYPSIRISDIKNYVIPIPFSNGSPDIKEQERIVKLLEEAEELTNKSNKAEELLDEYLKSVFYEMFYEKGFGTKAGKELFELAYGKGLSKKERDGGKYPVYGSNGVVGKHSRFLIKGPGIIIGRKGSIGEVNYSKKKFWAIDTTYYLKPLKKMDFIYLYYLLKFSNLKLNSSTAIPGLNRNDVYRINFIDPPLPLQQKFALIVEQVEKMKENINKTKQNSEELFNSLISKAFGGKL